MKQRVQQPYFEPRPPDMDSKPYSPRPIRRKLIASSSSPGFINKFKSLTDEDSVGTPMRSARRAFGRNKSCATFNVTNVSHNVQLSSHPLDFFIHEDSSEAEEIASLLITGKTPKSSDPQVIKLAISNLEYRRNVFQNSGDVRKALIIENAIQKARELLVEASKIEFQNAAIFDITLRECHANTDYKIFEHKTEMKSDDIEYKNEDLVEQMKMRHQKELQQHTEKWESEAMIRKYNKISPKLRELNIMRTKLMNSKQFDDADKIQQEIEKLEKIELEENIRKRQNDYSDSRNKLLDKQKHELECLIQSNQHKKVVFEKTVENQSEPYKQRQKALEYHHEIAKNKDKLWKLKKNKSSEILFSDNHPAVHSKHVDNPTKVLKLPPLKEIIRSKK